MTDNFIKSLIYKLNQKKAVESIFLKSLTNNIDVAIVWHTAKDYSSSTNKLYGPDKFYFIKNDTGKFVAAVNDGGGDLHWFVLPKYRGLGHLTAALKETIIPHIFQTSNKEEQRITINRNAIGDKNYIASTKVATTVGFVERNNNVGKAELFVSKSLYKDILISDSKPNSISDERFRVLKDKAHEITKALQKIESELEFYLDHSDLLEQLNETTCSVNRVPNIIYALQWDK